MNVRREPILKAATVVALVSALIGLLVAFGVPLTDAQRESIVALVTILAPFAVWWIARRSTTPLSDPRDNAGAPLRRTDGFDAVER